MNVNRSHESETSKRWPRGGQSHPTRNRKRRHFKSNKPRSKSRVGSKNKERKERPVNDGLTKQTAKRLCAFCPAGECKNEANDCYHMVGVNPNFDLDPSFVNFLIMNQKEQPIKSKPKCQLLPPEKKQDTEDNNSEERASTPEIDNRLPCRYCPLGLCENWKGDRTDPRFKHITCWFCPYTQDQIGLIEKTFNAKMNRVMRERQDELEDKKDEYDEGLKELEAVKGNMMVLLQKLASGEEIDPEFVKKLQEGKLSEPSDECDDDCDDSEDGIGVDETRRTVGARISLSSLIDMKDVAESNSVLQT